MFQFDGLQRQEQRLQQKTQNQQQGQPSLQGWYIRQLQDSGSEVNLTSSQTVSRMNNWELWNIYEQQHVTYVVYQERNITLWQ